MKKMICSKFKDCKKPCVAATPFKAAMSYVIKDLIKDKPECAGSRHVIITRKIRKLVKNKAPKDVYVPRNIGKENTENFLSASKYFTEAKYQNVGKYKFNQTRPSDELSMAVEEVGREISADFDFPSLPDSFDEPPPIGYSSEEVELIVKAARGITLSGTSSSAYYTNYEFVSSNTWTTTTT